MKLLKLWNVAWAIFFFFIAAWEVVIDGPVACGWAWDWRVMATSSCSWFAIAAEVLLTTGAFLSFWTAGYVLLTKRAR